MSHPSLVAGIVSQKDAPMHLDPGDSVAKRVVPPQQADETRPPSRDVLVIESDTALCDRIAEVVESLGGRVTCIPSGADALTSLAERAFDMLIVGRHSKMIDPVDIVSLLRYVRDPKTISVVMIEPRAHALHSTAVSSSIDAVVPESDISLRLPAIFRRTRSAIGVPL